MKASFVGDVLIHKNLATRALGDTGYSFARNFEEITEHISSADLACANLESVTAGAQFGISGYPKFNAPVELLGDLRGAGFSVLNVANNHMLDKGEDALLASLQNIQNAGLSFLGASGDADAPDGGTVFEVGGVRIGFLAYTDGSKMSTSLIEKSHINFFAGEYQNVRMVRRLLPIKKRLAELKERSDIVVLQLHFGEEYLRYPSAFQREFVAGLCEGDVDVIIGHHPHVLQPSEWVENSRGKHVLVMYSLGNFFTGQLGLHRQIGGIFSFGVAQTETGRAHVVEPELLLTYVDSRKRYRIRTLESVAREYPRVKSAGYDEIETGPLYDRVLAHARTYIPDLRVR